MTAASWQRWADRGLPPLRRLLTWEVLFVAALTLAAALLRTLLLTEFPPGLQGDESWSGLEAQRILDEGWIGIWTRAGWGQPTGPMYWTAFLFSFLPDDIATLRLSYAVFGLVSVPLFYLFARELFGQRAAVLGALLLAVSFWHIHYSRTAFTLNAAVPLELAALFLMALALRKDSLGLSALAGVMIGLGVYTYRANNAFLAALVALWLFMLLRRERPLGDTVRHALALWLPALLLATPMIHFVITRTSDYRGYVDVISIFNTAGWKEAGGLWGQFTFLLGEMKRGIALYFTGQTPDYTSGLGGYPILDRVTMALFAVGLGVSLWRWRDWRHFLILAGVAAGVGLVAATVEWGGSRRNISALPMVFAAAGVGGDWLIGWAERLYERLAGLRPAWLYPTAAAAAVGAALLLNVPFYFNEVATSRIAKFAYNDDLVAALEYVQGLPETPYVYFLANRWGFDYEVRRFLAPDLPGEDRSEEFGEFSLKVDREGEPVVFLLLGRYQRFATVLMSQYPYGRYVERWDSDGRFLFGAFYVDAAPLVAEGW